MSDGPAASHLIDLVPDELALARTQIDSGLAILAEATLRRRIAWLEADAASASGDEIDAARGLLAEAFWRQGRPQAARGAIEAMRPASPQRRLPMTMIVEAEALAASGELDRASGLMERVVGSVGADEAWRLRAGQTGRLAWPLPAELLPPERAPARPPWVDRTGADQEPEEPAPAERAAAARGRLASARAAYGAGDLERGDHELSLALRLDPAIAFDGLTLLDPILAERPPAERLLLYGDLLRAAGRESDAAAAYDRAIERRS